LFPRPCSCREKREVSPAVLGRFLRGECPDPSICRAAGGGDLTCSRSRRKRGTRWYFTEILPHLSSSHAHECVRDARTTNINARPPSKSPLTAPRTAQTTTSTSRPFHREVIRATHTPHSLRLLSSNPTQARRCAAYTVARVAEIYYPRTSSPQHRSSDGQEAARG
jgi:hypothetical protein